MSSVQQSYFKQRIALFSHRNFRNYLISCMLAMFGNGLTYIIMTWVLMQQNSSVSAVAIMMACFWIPNIVLGPIFGVLVDRFSRKNCILIANSIRAIVLLAFALLVSFVLNEWVIYLLAVILGGVLSLYIPAALTLVREIVPEDQLLYANATVDIAYEIGAVVGMGSAGFVLALTSVESSFLINAGCYLIATFLMLRIDYSADNKEYKCLSFWQEFKSGWDYLLNKWSLLIMYAVQMLLFVCYMTAPVLLAPFAKTVLHTSVGQFGAIEAALSVGLIVGGIVSPYLSGKVGLVPLMIGEALLAIVGFILFSHTQVILLSILWYFCIGFSFSVWALLVTHAQHLTDINYQGRVQSLFSSLSGVFILLFYMLLGKVSYGVQVTDLYWVESGIMVLCIALLLYYVSYQRRCEYQ